MVVYETWRERERERERERRERERESTIIYPGEFFFSFTDDFF
jgi:hypothetical protein